MDKKMKPQIYGIYKQFLTWFGDIMVATKPPETKAQQIREMEKFIKLILKYKFLE
jgi:hypothetical protein